MQKNFYFSQRSLMWNAVVLMHKIDFTSDSYNFLDNFSTLYYISIFNIMLDIFIIFKVYFSLIEYICLISYVTECPMF